MSGSEEDRRAGRREGEESSSRQWWWRDEVSHFVGVRRQKTWLEKERERSFGGGVEVAPWIIWLSNMERFWCWVVHLCFSDGVGILTIIKPKPTNTSVGSYCNFFFLGQNQRERLITKICSSIYFIIILTK